MLHMKSMAMYYQGSSEIQADGLQTLYLMNPNFVGYTDSTQHHPTQPNMLFFNSAAAATTAATTTTTTVHGFNSTVVPHAPLPQSQQLVGLPQSHDPSRPSSLLGQQEIQAPRFQYNIYGLIDQSTNVNQTNTPQALSLSLSAAHHQTRDGGFDKPIPASDHQDFPAKICCSLSQATTESSGVNTVQSVITGSKYLKAAQELLDEVANVGKGTKNDRTAVEGSRYKAKIVKESTRTDGGGAPGSENGNKSGGGAELTTAQRQEIQMKKAKLSSMLDEVEQRYRQYHQQMQIVVASFEQAAGIGSAKSYTQLALKTILKQFRSLKCTISVQIKALSRSLGEEEINFGEKLEGSSRLRFVDHQLRQQRAMQQLGMIHNNAWRPQRGLPERAVSVLRAWLFEHFLHPYPKDSDKHMLAKQTGLTRSQVSNWFINARVRLWKPMVEEMYVEEMKNQDQITSDHNTTSKLAGPDKELAAASSKFNPGQENNNSKTASTVSTSPTGSSFQARPGFAHLITSLNMENLPEKNPKKPRNEAYQDNSPSSRLSADMEMKAAGETSKGFFNNVKFGPGRENYLSMAAAAGNTTTYGTIGGLGRFNADHQQMVSTGLNFQANNNFSLSLALPPSETSQRAHQPNFLSHRSFEFGTRIGSEGVESSGINNQANIGYEILDFQSRKPFPAQLLPDFVA